MGLLEDLPLSILSMAALSLLLVIGYMMAVRSFDPKSCKSEKKRKYPKHPAPPGKFLSYPDKKIFNIPVQQELSHPKQFSLSQQNKHVPFNRSIEKYVKTSPDAAVKVLKSWLKDA
ncbi:MAG: hypothetical protein JXR73_03135 [Candidatus Omnitrophica bacterium]|nr:hypothetical protein [Candidatus Omnitrophota bacterium]